MLLDIKLLSTCLSSARRMGQGDCIELKPGILEVTLVDTHEDMMKFPGSDYHIASYNVDGISDLAYLVV